MGRTDAMRKFVPQSTETTLLEDKTADGVRTFKVSVGSAAAWPASGEFDILIEGERHRVQSTSRVLEDK